MLGTIQIIRITQGGWVDKVSPELSVFNVFESNQLGLRATFGLKRHFHTYSFISLFSIKIANGILQFIL